MLTLTTPIVQPNILSAKPLSLIVDLVTGDVTLMLEMIDAMGGITTFRIDHAGAETEALRAAVKDQMYALLKSRLGQGTVSAESVSAPASK